MKNDILRAIIIMKNYIQKSKYTTSYLPATRKKNTLEEATQPEEDVKEKKSTEKEKPISRFSETLTSTVGDTIEEDEARKHWSIESFQEM